MTKGKSKSGNEFSYVFDKLNKAVDKCDNSSLEWVAAATRRNEKDLYKEDIMEDTYLERQQKISSLIASFSYNCISYPKTQPIML